MTSELKYRLSCSLFPDQLPETYWSKEDVGEDSNFDMIVTTEDISSFKILSCPNLEPYWNNIVGCHVSFEKTSSQMDVIVIDRGPYVSFTFLLTKIELINEESS